MKRSKKETTGNKVLPAAEAIDDGLFAEVAGILEAARRQTARSVNTYMVAAHWLIGRRIVEAEQSGQARAAYGEPLIEGLSARLTERYGRGFSAANLKNFREFYLTFPNRTVTAPFELSGDTAARPLEIPSGNRYPAGSGSDSPEQSPEIRYPVGSESPLGFHPNLGWSHYRGLMRVENQDARLFYETEAVKAQWSKRELERQIGSLYYERLLASRDKRGMLAENRRKGTPALPLEVIKDPYVLEFLNLPEDHRLNETELEERIITHLKEFLLELGHGFAFIGRQQRLTLDGDHF